MVLLAGRVAQAPRAAVLRATGHWSKLIHTAAVPRRTQSFGDVFETVVRDATGRGDLPGGVDEAEVAALLQAAVMDALVGWAATDQAASGLQQSLCRRADVILRGAAASYG
jgi:hypothetical protein